MYWLAVVAGLLGGLLGPLIGVGGGVIIVPMLNISGVPFQAAAAASLFSIAVTAVTSIYNYRKLIDFKMLGRYAAVSLSAAAASAFLSVRYSGTWIKLAYGIYLIAIGLVMLKTGGPAGSRPGLGIS